MSSRESESDIRRCAVAAAAWLVTCCAAVCVAALGILSVGKLRSAVEIESSYVALVVAQAVFLVFIWPLFESRGASGRDGGLPGLCVRLAVLFVLSLPLLLLTLRTREIGLGAVVWSQVLVFLMGVTAGVAVRLPGAVSWYMPCAFLLSAVVPLAAYMLFEEGRVSAVWAGAVSPPWAAAAVASGGGRLAPLLIFACLGVGVSLVFLRARVVAPDQG
ncbi:MAG: hypothetical protein ABIF82_08390 [Planctomycetota bacterium]